MKHMIRSLIHRFMGNWYLPDIQLTDILEVLIIAFLAYQLMVWIKNTKAWMLLKGIIFLGVFILVAAVLKMNTILWIAKNSIGVLATAAVVVFQPELRRALEKLGQRGLAGIVPVSRAESGGKFTQATLDGIVEACFEMSAAKTGALIVVEQEIVLTEYQHTGIDLDCIVSRQVLMNIFEHNTPLHDGAVIVREDRIVSATCYLPLTDNREISKELGTRHRAAVGMSEVSDALVIAVSEETGYVSYAYGGRLKRNVTEDQLRHMLTTIQNKTESKRSLWKKGWQRDHGQNKK